MKRLMSLSPLLVTLSGIPSCTEDRPSVSSEQQASHLAVTGVIRDGCLKMFPISIKGDAWEYPLDLTTVPSNIIGKTCKVEGDVVRLHGTIVVTNVTIDGTRYQTVRELVSGRSEPDPFDPK